MRLRESARFIQHSIASLDHIILFRLCPMTYQVHFPNKSPPFAVQKRSFSITKYTYRIMGFVEEPFQFVELVNGEVRSGSSLLPCNDHNADGPSVTSIDSKMFSGLNSPDPSSLLVVAAEDGLCGSNLLESPVQRQERRAKNPY